jgi:hypothetical protein
MLSSVTLDEDSNMAGEFPLEQWFDLSGRISREDADTAEAQMALYAFKDGLDPDCAECQKEYRKLRTAVEKHNRQFVHTELSKLEVSATAQTFTVFQLRKLAQMAGVRQNKWIKGGRKVKLTKDELIHELRRALANTFADRKERVAAAISDFQA